MSKFEMCEKLIDALGVVELLDALVMAMSETEACENFEFIARCYDLDLDLDDDEE